MAGATALAAFVVAKLITVLFAITVDVTLVVPVVAVALLIGMALSRHLATAVSMPGLVFCSGPLLRFLVALLGLRVSLSEVSELGLGLALAVVATMALTFGVAVGSARALGLSACTGALIGSANAVCGAAATLATSSALPADRDRSASVSLTIVLAGAVSTLCMLLYPMLAGAIGLSALQSGVFVGLSIHDVAQVVGAGLTLSPEAAAIAITVKMFRVLMLLPVVLLIAWAWRGGPHDGTAPSVRIPRFAIWFCVLSVINSALLMVPAAAAVYVPLRAAANELTNLGLSVSIAALGITTTVPMLWKLGPRPIVVFAVATLTILAGSLVSVVVLVR
ncbi:MAG: YeiH family protein [Hyphomicrobiaceae bacterium]|nr:YeiH family protein [Hyphomicrobiaceae bacterium]